MIEREASFARVKTHAAIELHRVSCRQRTATHDGIAGKVQQRGTFLLPRDGENVDAPMNTIRESAHPHPLALEVLPVVWRAELKSTLVANAN